MGEIQVLAGDREDFLRVSSGDDVGADCEQVMYAISAPRTVAKVMRFTVVGRRQLPVQRQLCLPPGARAPQVCT